MTAYLPLIPIAAVLAFVSWLAWRWPYYEEATEGLEICSIENCDAILRGYVYVWERGLRSQRVCHWCAEEMSARWPALTIRLER